MSSGTCPTQQVERLKAEAGRRRAPPRPVLVTSIDPSREVWGGAVSPARVRCLADLLRAHVEQSQTLFSTLITVDSKLCVERGLLEAGASASVSSLG